MATKKEIKIVKTTQSEITEGYAIYHVDEKKYTDDYCDCVEELNSAFIFDTQQQAQNTLEENDCPNDFEIHQIKMTFDVLKVIKRKVIYEEVEDDE